MITANLSLGLVFLIIKTKNILTTYTYDIQNGQLPFLPIADPAILHPVEDSAISLKI